MRSAIARLLAPVLVLPLAPRVAQAGAASVCAAQVGASAASQDAETSAKPDWVLDHYVRSAAQGREWAVMVDCNHPGAPERMRPVPGRRVNKVAGSSSGRTAAAPLVIASPVVIRAGTPVTVVNAPEAAVAMNLTGVAVTSAQAGRMIRVRLEVFHALVKGIVRGPGTVELVAAVHSQWGQP